MRTLYILGNGFDLHHGLDTRYQHFCFFLQDTNRELYENLTAYFPLPDLDRTNPASMSDPLWKDFEQALSQLDTDSVMDRYSDYAADTSSPDFRDRDWGTFSIETGRFVEKMTKGLIEALGNFIRTLNYPESIESKKINLLPESLYLSFNYTNTLERYYGVSQDSICYLHGKAELDNDLILGHGNEPSDFEAEDPQPPVGLSDEESEFWREEMSNSYNHSTELAKDTLSSYYDASYKNMLEVIKRNTTFFQSLKDVGQLVILGHSLNDIDLPYFECIAASVNPHSIWYCSYFEEEGQEEHWSTLTGIGIPADKIILRKITAWIASER